MANIPDRANFYAALTTTLSRKSVAQLYERKGWKVRKASWTDYEILSDWAELTIELRKSNIEVNAIGNSSRPDEYRCQSAEATIYIRIKDRVEWDSPHPVVVEIPPVARIATLELVHRIQDVLQRAGGERII